MKLVFATCSLLLALAVPAVAAEQWAQPAKTEQWSKPTTTQQRSTENVRLSASIKPEARMVGAWSLRIPTGVSYEQQHDAVYRRLDAGANMDRLVIQASGAYTWGRKKGQLRAIKPYFAQPNVRYFEVKNAQGSYILYAKSAQELVLLFDVGGFVAKGTRLR